MGNVLYVNKPPGMSSFDVCFKLRKVLGTKKIGHTGTLDPNANGVMIILFDNATKANQFLVSDKKEYKTKVIFGKISDTLDLDSKNIIDCEYIMPKTEEIITCLNYFKGKSMQEVPLTSAIKVNGKKLYQYQYEGKKVEIPSREIEVFDITLNHMTDNGFVFTCNVSSGTYIRALVRDICKKLNIQGCVCELERTMIDNIKIEDCDNLNDILMGNYRTHDLLEVLSLRYNTYETSKKDDVINGKPLYIDSDDDMLLITSKGELLAMYKKDIDSYRCMRGLM